MLSPLLKILWTACGSVYIKASTQLQQYLTNHLLYTSGNWNLNTREIIVNSSIPTSPPPWWLLPRGVMLSPLFSLQGPSPNPPRGSCSRSSLTPTYKVWFFPLTPHFLSTSLRFCTVGIPFPSFTVGLEPSKPLSGYLSISITWYYGGTLRLVTSRPRLGLTFGKASAAVALVSHINFLD